MEKEKFNVLVVDDEKEIRDAIDIYLRGEGINVIKAGDGFEALEILFAISFKSFASILSIFFSSS